MTPEQLIEHYPNLDFMMAETLLKAEESGLLAEVMADVDLNQPRLDVVQTTVVVEPPEKKCDAVMETCEGTGLN